MIARSTSATTCFLALAAALAAFDTSGADGRAHAGIVNVQSALATEAKEGVSGSVTGSVDWQTGNRERLLFRLAPVIRLRAGKHLLIGMANGDYLRENDDLRVFEHLRYRYQFNKRWIGEVFAQHEYNEKRLLLLRALVGMGVRYQILDCKKTQIGVGVAYMAEYEVLKEDADFGPVPEYESPLFNNRLSSYITGSYEVDDRVQLAQTLYVQPLITDLADIRLFSESAVTLRITKALLFRTSLVLSYDHKPPDYGGVKPLDSTLLSSIVYNF